MQNDSRNMVVFAVLAVAILGLYQFFVFGPQEKRREAEARAHAAAQATATAPGAPQAVVTIPRQQALAQSPRVSIATPALSGSVSLRGARIDDLFLTQYRQTVDKRSPPVELFRPAGAANAYYADFGWTGANLQGLPGEDTAWTLSQGQTLSPNHPVVLTYRSAQGLEFTRTIAVDDRAMFTVTDTVANQGPTPVTVAPFASVQRQGLPDDVLRAVNVHQGAIGWLGAEPSLKLAGYKSWKKKGELDFPSRGGWLGITDKYWMATLIPDQGEQIRGAFRVTPATGGEIYDASFLGGYRTIAPGRQVSSTTRLFAGAKTVPLLRAYTHELGVPELDRAVDWGRLFFLTRPIFGVLEFFFHLVGNFGVAILMLTVCVRLVFFWPQTKSYESMTKMKRVQPELEKLRARYKEDPMKLQQEMAQLYQREKINPLLGCLPILPTIPVFLALFKVLSVTIEMRHAPFFGWVHDLSARDPTTLWNLFGLIPWDPAHAPLIGGLLDGSLHIGVWAILYGFTMWLTTSMSPQTGMDPTQQKMMQFFPLVFTFVLANFAVGLLIYYTWSNLLALVQQYVIMRRFKVDNPIDQFIGRLKARGQASG
jgi:YidC/Oxa1 family membrane protein insertase